MPAQRLPLRAAQSGRGNTTRSRGGRSCPAGGGSLEMARDRRTVGVLPVALRQVEFRGIGQVPGVVLALQGLVFIAASSPRRGASCNSRAGGDGLAPLPDDAAASQCRREHEQADQDRVTGWRRAYFQSRSVGRDRPGQDRLAVEPSFKVLGQLAGRGVALLGSFSGISGRSSPGRGRPGG